MQLQNGELLMFADDTVLIFKGSSWEQVRQSAELGLSKVTAWLEHSLLSLNTYKTKYICFCITNYGKPEADFSLTIHTHPCNLNSGVRSNCKCSALCRTSSIKYLGTMIDENLSWDSHLSLTSGRIRKLMFVFKNLRSIATFPLLIKIYKALVESLLCYCICAWGGAAQTHLIQLERAQRAVLKVLMSLPIRHPTLLLYENTKLLSVRRLFVYQLIRRFHSKLAPHIPVPAKRIVRYPVPFVRTSFAQKSFNFLAPRTYNILQRKLNLIQYTNRQIKKLLHHHLLGLSETYISILITPLN